MTDAQLKTFRRQLTALQDRLSRQDADLRDEAMQPTGGEASGGLSNSPIHNADLGTHEYEEEIALRLMDNEEHILVEVQAALERLDKGVFGRCEACQTRIGIDRLNSLPYARYCIACESQKEREAAR